MYKDITSYSRDDRERKPRILENSVNDIIFKIHKHIYFEDEWLLSCAELGIDKKQLDTYEMEEAKVRGIMLMRKLLQDRIEKYQKAVDKLSE